MTKNILIIAGEASGDMHAANLVNATLQLNPDINFFGIGGNKMHKAGVNILINSTELAVMGLDIVTRLPQIFYVLKTIRKILTKNFLDLVILVDYPGLNLHVAKLAKKAGIKVLYYISPKLWASRQYRVKIMRDYVDQIAVIFPFEVNFYKQFNIPVKFVGNPLTAIAKPSLSKQQAYEKFGLTDKNKIIGLFPGSRKGEIKRLLPIMLKTAALLRNNFANAQFVLPLASSLSEDALLPYLKNCPISIKIIKNDIYDLINVCDAIIAASGTVTLEIALIGTPMVIIYKIFPPYFPIKKIINIKHIGLCNIIAQKEIIKELLQQHANPKEIYKEIERILNDDAYRHKMREELQQIKRHLISEKTENLAELVLHMVNTSHREQQY